MHRLEATLKKSGPAGPGASVVSFSTACLDRPPVPGQFFMVKLLVPGFPLFGRALAVLDYSADASRAEIGFLVKEVGRGTAIIRAAGSGTPALLVGPAGNSFPSLDPEAHVLFVAGGTGVAAFHYMMRGMRRDAFPPERRPLLLYGARDKPSLYLRDALEALPLRIRVSTEDGSEGLRGLVTALLAEALDGPDFTAATRVFACGPDPMMKAVSTLCAENDIDCFLSLEGRMACGIGVCNGCAVEVEREGRKAYERVCYEGPVFKASILPFYRGPEVKPDGDGPPSAGP